MRHTNTKRQRTEARPRWLFNLRQNRNKEFRRSSKLAHDSAEEALNAALAAVELAAEPGFEGTHEELEQLLAEGLNSAGEPVEADAAYWARLRADTDRMAAEHQTRNRRP